MRSVICASCFGPRRCLRRPEPEEARKQNLIGVMAVDALIEPFRTRAIRLDGDLECDDIHPWLPEVSAAWCP